MSFDTVCFDCDSTLSRVEGIDELARRNGMFERVAELTNAAMNGELALEEVYENRLALIKPDKASVDWLAQLYIDEVVPGARDTIAKLQQQHKQVHIISGGLRQAILPLAEFLGVPSQQVHAVDIELSEEGAYLGYAKASPLAYSGGKAKVCKQIIDGNGVLAMVGDGKTDLEAKQAGATVIGFGGVVARDAVKAQADYFVAGPDLTAVLAYLL
ncbi:HAD-IB family phosphatase [Methylomarinum sp. Ch1-1]|uniref:phosphoserine phosphatase n=1 Tax=Methylomarinum roseum TaxID=3067653 RepID=A0AAU7NUC0_9GAMM|nr:HAD-IB family phosphatase [Methylomarinum sp. Ch1-1]MDP4519399.1 HAD-IB family phosphatase [Methylomarinum sp. Ch1-1]